MPNRFFRAIRRRPALLKAIARLGTTGLLLAVLFPAAAQPTIELAIGQFAYRPKAILQGMWSPLVQHLQDRLPEHVRLTLRVLSQPEMEAALLRNELDYVFTNPVHYVQLRESNQLSGALATLISKEDNIAVSSLGGVVIRRRDRTDIQQLDDLRTAKIAIAGTQYLGGYTAQSVELKARGIAPASLDYLETGQPHDRVVQAVLNREADVGYVRTGVLEQLENEGALAIGDLAVVGSVPDPGFPFLRSTRLYPEWAFVALPQAPEDISRRIAGLLLSLDPASRAAQAAGIEGFTIPADYSVVQHAMETLRLPPFDKLPDFDWRDVLQRYPVQIAAGTLGGLIILGLAMALAAISRRERQARITSDDLRSRVQGIIDGTRAGTWEWNVQTGETRFNERWAQIVGYTLAELEPVSIDTWQRFAHPDDLAVSNAALQDHFAGLADSYQVTVRMRHKSGDWVWVNDRGRVLSWTTDGKPEWMFGTHVEVTNEVLAEQERTDWLKRFEDLSANVPGALYQYRQRPDGSSHFPFASTGLYSIYGCRPEDIRDDASAVFEAIHPDDRPLIHSSVAESIQSNTVWHAEFRVNHPEKGERWIEGSATPSAENDGGTAWYGYLRDITDLRRANERMRLAAQVFGSSREGIVILDADGRIVEVNAAFSSRTGYTLADLKGQTTDLLHSPAQPATFYQAVQTAVEQEGHWSGEYWLRTKDGESHPQLLSIAAVHDEQNRITSYVAIINDIRELKAHEQELDRMAHLDQLTGLPNRRRMQLELEAAVRKVAGQGGQLAVGMMDLDKFKQVNDTYGHEAGDMLLIEIAHRFSQMVRTGDTVARLGGDEFVLILPDTDGTEVIERILDAARRPVDLPQGTAFVSASIGLAYFDARTATDADTLLRQADQALYTAKSQGRDRYCIFGLPGRDVV
ncbi:MAG: PAS domain-containing protein [Burkholderiaceae bacterium]